MKIQKGYLFYSLCFLGVASFSALVGYFVLPKEEVPVNLPKKPFVTKNVSQDSRGQKEGPEHANKTAGNFEYYVVTAAWAPAFLNKRHICRSSGLDFDSAACAKLFEKQVVIYGKNMIHHGLWPTSTPVKNAPLFCLEDPGKVPQDSLDKISKFMPPTLAQHEWEKHGTCVREGITPQEYFDLFLETFSKVKWSALAQLAKTKKGDFSLRLQELKELFQKSNPQIPQNSFYLVCTNTKESSVFNEAAVCADKNLKSFIPCPDSVPVAIACGEEVKIVNGFPNSLEKGKNSLKNRAAQ